jgi:hypothetical protein
VCCLISVYRSVCESEIDPFFLMFLIQFFFVLLLKAFLLLKASGNQ